MTAPTLVASYLPSGTTGGTGNWSNSTTPKTASVTTATGDLLITMAAAEDGSATFTSPTGGAGVSWAHVADAGTAGAGAAAGAWVAQPSAQTLTESISNIGATHHWSFATVRISGATGTGTPVSTPNGGAAPSLAITTTQANSGILVLIADWNAVTGTSYTYRQVNGSNPTEIVAGAGTAGSDYRVWVLWYPDAGAAGAKTVGMTLPGGQTPSMIAIEVKGNIISGGSVTGVKATATSAAGTPSVSGTSSGIKTDSPWSSPQLVTTNSTSAVSGVAATASAAVIVPHLLTAPGVPSGSPWSAPVMINVTAASSPVISVVGAASAATGFPVITSNRTVTGGGPAAGSAQANAPVVGGITGGAVTVVVVVAGGGTSTAPAPAITVETVTTGGGPGTATAFAAGPQVTATTTVVGGVIAALAALADALAVPPVATGTTDTPPTTEPVWLFSPPTHEEGIRVGNHWLRHFRTTHANSIYWNGTQWVSARAVNDDIVRTLEEGVTYFRGGSPYVIDAATAQSLIAAGYTPILAT